MTALWDAYNNRMALSSIIPNQIKDGVIGQAMLECQRGTTKVATDGLNFHAMQYRKEMAPYCKGSMLYERYTYATFSSMDQEIAYYWKRVHLPVYGDVDSHLQNSREYLSFIGPKYCFPGYKTNWHGYTKYHKNYHEYICDLLLPEAREQLKKFGWTPTVVIPDPIPVPIPIPIPYPMFKEYEIRDGMIYYDGVQIPYYETPNYTANKKNTNSRILLHYTAAKNFNGIIQAMQDIKNDAAPILIGSEGQIAQLAPLDRVVHHSGNSYYNGDSTGVELEGWGCSRVTLGNYVVFWRWFPTGKRMELVPKSDCIYAPHPKEPRIWRWWPKFPEAQYETLRKFISAWERWKGVLEGQAPIMEHSQVIPSRLDVGPAFDWKEIGRG